MPFAKKQHNLLLVQEKYRLLCCSEACAPSRKDKVHARVFTRKQLSDALSRTGADCWGLAPMYLSVGQQHWGQEEHHESQIPV